MLPEIIGIVGPIRAGKTTAATYLVERYGYTLASNSDILRRILDGMAIVPNRVNLASLGDAIFEVLGNNIIAKYRVDNLRLGRIVVDGIRYVDELKSYSEVPSFKLLGINANSSIRFDRTLNSSEGVKDLNISRPEFDRFALLRSELNVPQLLSVADVIISNIRDVKFLHDSIDKALEDWSR